MRPSIKRRLLWILLWVERIRPTVCRSGFKGSVLSVALLLYVMTPSGGAFTQELPSLCSLFGIGCPEPIPKPPSEPPQRQWRPLLLMNGHGPGKLTHYCHQQFHYPGTIIDFAQFADCATIDGPVDVWITIPSGGSCSTSVDQLVVGCPEWRYDHPNPDGTETSEIIDARRWVYNDNDDNPFKIVK